MLDLSSIQWPIFPLRDDIPIQISEGEKFIEMPDGSYRLLDTSEFEGNLAQRRLQYHCSTRLFWKKLFELEKPLFRFEMLLHYSAKCTRFIDSNGKIFKYRKSTYYPLSYHKIEKFVETPRGYAVVVKGFHCRFFIPVEPALEWKYAGIITVGRGFVLYDFSEVQKKSTRRMI